MIRYPGSKAKIVKQILRHFPTEVMDALWRSDHTDYREPFFGGGALGFALIRRLPPSKTSLWLNDRDFGVACLWRAVHEDHERLREMVSDFVPSPQEFERLKREDAITDMDPVRIGFQKLALHQISFSGLGVMAGGPIGGKHQSSRFNVNCRWNPSRLRREIEETHTLLSNFVSVKISSCDFEAVLGNASGAFFYADPPYYEKGSALYKHAMSDDDHRRLAAALRGCRSWVLSYDDHPFIRDLYSWASISSVEMTYTMAVAKQARRKNSEIIIKPPLASERAA